MLLGTLILGATIKVINIAKAIFMRIGICLLPKTGALAMSAKMRVSGKINAAIQAVSWALVTLIMMPYGNHVEEQEVSRPTRECC